MSKVSLFTVVYVNRSGETGRVAVRASTAAEAVAAFLTAAPELGQPVCCIGPFWKVTPDTQQDQVSEKAKERNTFQQKERDILAAIMQMVEEVGPDSHVAAAFEGCFDLAETNIESGRFDSLRKHVEAADQRIAEFAAENDKLNEELDAERAKADAYLDRAKDAQKELLRLKARLRSILN